MVTPGPVHHHRASWIIKHNGTFKCWFRILLKINTIRTIGFIDIFRLFASGLRAMKKGPVSFTFLAFFKKTYLYIWDRLNKAERTKSEQIRFVFSRLPEWHMNSMQIFSCGFLKSLACWAGSIGTCIINKGYTSLSH